MALELTPAAAEELARAGFDPVYGARPLKRAIQKELVQPLAVRLLQGEFGDGDTIVVDAGTDGRLTFASPHPQGRLRTAAGVPSLSRLTETRSPSAAAIRDRSSR